MEGEREGEGVEAEDISRIGAHINLVSPNTTHLTICPDGHNATTCTPQPQSAAILATSSAARPIFPSPTPIAKSTQSSVIRNTPTTEDFAAIPMIKAIDHWSALQQAVCKEDWAGLSSQQKRSLLNGLQEAAIENDGQTGSAQDGFAMINRHGA